MPVKLTTFYFYTKKTVLVYSCNADSGPLDNSGVRGADHPTVSPKSSHWSRASAYAESQPWIKNTSALWSKQTVWVTLHSVYHWVFHLINLFLSKVQPARLCSWRAGLPSLHVIHAPTGTTACVGALGRWWSHGSAVLTRCSSYTQQGVKPPHVTS